MRDRFVIDLCKDDEVHELKAITTLGLDISNFQLYIFCPIRKLKNEEKKNA